MKKLISLSLISIPLIVQAKETATECLAKNIYHESRGETRLGQLAVAQVTLNRHRKTKKSICEVVYEPKQFSWTEDKPQIRDFTSWIRSVVIANRVLEQGWALRNFPATHYHTIEVSPSWRLNLFEFKKIGNHIFYYEI